MGKTLLSGDKVFTNCPQSFLDTPVNKFYITVVYMRARTFSMVMVFLQYYIFLYLAVHPYKL